MYLVSHQGSQWICPARGPVPLGTALRGTPLVHLMEPGVTRTGSPNRKIRCHRHTRRGREGGGGAMMDFFSIYMESRKMVLMNLSAGQE